MLCFSVIVKRGWPSVRCIGEMLSLQYQTCFVSLSLFSDYPVVYLTDLDLVKQVLVSNCYKYYRPEAVKLMIPPLGNSLLTSNGKEHAWQRKMLNPAFSYAYLKGMVPFMKTAADDLVQVLNGELTFVPPA